MRAVTMFLLAAPCLLSQSQAVLAGLATGSYFPLDVGDRWVFRVDSRLQTGAYETWRVDRTEVQNGATYSVMAVEGPASFYGESWFRADASGKIYQLTGNGEQLFFDPSAQSAGGQLQVTGRGGTAATPLGTFPDVVSYRNPVNELDLETGTLARGIGLISSSTQVLAGSSGGFLEGRTLVEATVAGIRFPAPAASVQLSIESLTLNVSGQKVTNCAVPCYFAACRLAPGADPPGTYKPCAQARVELMNWPAGQSRTVRLQLLAPDHSTAFDQTATLDAAAQESVLFVQLPLYSAPNEPLPPGAYQLAAGTLDGSAQSSLTVQIQ